MNIIKRLINRLRRKPNVKAKWTKAEELRWWDNHVQECQMDNSVNCKCFKVSLKRYKSLLKETTKGR